MTYPTEINARTLTIRYRGLFDFDGLYNVIVQWMKARRFWFHETKYKHKVSSPFGAEQEITFTGDKKVTDFYAHAITIDLHLWDMTEVEVVQKGIKKTLTNARMQIDIQGTLSLEYEKRWEVSTFWMAVRDWWMKYIMRREVESIYYDEIYYRTYRLHNVIKKFLDMEAKGHEYEGYLGDNA